MSSDKQNASVYAGDSAIFSISIVKEDGSPLPLSSVSLTWTLAANATSAAVLTKSTTSGGVTLTHAAAGVAAVSLSAGETTALSGPMWHQLVLTDGSNNVNAVTTGTITFIPRV